MPIVSSDYNPPFLFKNGHFSTIYAGILRKITDFEQKRERIDLPDGDFLDLDWSHSCSKTRKVVILLHGLEGNAQRAYISGCAKHLNQNNFDTCAVNLRGCGGEINLLYRGYHSGATEDLHAVVKHIHNTRDYSEIFITGFSLGGNISLKYLGEGTKISSKIKAVVGISVPCSLESCAIELMKPKNFAYAAKFKNNLISKLREKQTLFPNEIETAKIKTIKTLRDFDDVYTSRAHGYIDSLDYYTQCSCKQFLPNIKIPSLLINAKNDSFLGNDCYPTKEAEQNSNIFLEMPKYGGHVGFYGKNNITYTEKRVIKFFKEVR